MAETLATLSRERSQVAKAFNLLFIEGHLCLTNTSPDGIALGDVHKDIEPRLVAFVSSAVYTKTSSPQISWVMIMFEPGVSAAGSAKMPLKPFRTRTKQPSEFGRF